MREPGSENTYRFRIRRGLYKRKSGKMPVNQKTSCIRGIRRTPEKRDLRLLPGIDGLPVDRKGLFENPEFLEFLRQFKSESVEIESWL